MAAGSLAKVCASFANAIKLLTKQIGIDERLVLKLKNELATLQSQPKPDAAAISAKQEELKKAQEKLGSDRGELEAFQNEFDANCR